MTERIVLPEWGCVVSVIDGQLCSAPLPLAPNHEDGPLVPVDLVCEHFLDAVNKALGTSFTPREFPIVSCESHAQGTP